MDPKAAAQAEVGRAGAGLVELSHTVHAHPELGFEEERSSAWAADALTGGRFSVEGGVGHLPTAFVATAGSGPLTIGICAEYDALPAIGHACGHNIICAAAVGAGLALLPPADGLGIPVKVLGTPAEEGGGGKILMLERGVFDGVHAAMMVHPSPTEMPEMPCLAVSHLDVHYTGKEAHASAWPEQGINGADALTIAQVGIGLLRQHIPQTDPLPGIVTHGGDPPNVVPGHTSGTFLVRSRTLAELTDLEPRVRACFEAGALATGCTHDVTPVSPPYSEFDHDAAMVQVYRRNAEQLGRVFPDIPQVLRERTAGSTDMANLSLAMPAIHPMLGLDCLPAVNHQPEFTAACITPRADQAVVDGALAMAWTTIDLATEETQRERLLSRTQ